MRNRQQDIEVLNELKDILSKRIMIVDGATGTALQSLKPSTGNYGGEKYVGCYECLNLYSPHIVDHVHKDYIEAGADTIETNSFNGSRFVMEEYGLANRAGEMQTLSAKIAKEAVRKYSGKRKVFVMGSMGPGTKSITVTGGIDYNTVFEVYRDYATSLLKGDVDILLLETVQDTLNLKAAINGVKQALKDLDRAVPLSVSVTIEAGGTMLGGQNIEALYHTLAAYDLFSIGLNCAVGPDKMTDHLRTLSEISRFPVSVWPNAGLPDEDGNYSDTPETFSKSIRRFADEGFINIAGGCCGTTAAHIKQVRKATIDVKPRIPNSENYFQAIAGNEAMVVVEDNRPVFIGERTNTIGSRKFKRLVSEEKWDEACEIGRNQVKKGAMVLDLCTANPDRDELKDFTRVLRPLLRKVRVPIMLDTTDPEVIKESLKWIGGKPAINSVNLEDGGERLRQIAELAMKNSASLVCGLIDDDPEQSMAVTLERKLEIAEKIYDILVKEIGFPEEDIIFDPLVFPAGTGEPQYRGSAVNTIEGVLKIKELYPRCLTILGISNISFGLPVSGREVVNSVFLQECTKAGLDLAIVNTQRLKRFPTISKKEIDLSKKVLEYGDSESIGSFVKHFRDKVESTESEDEWKKLTIEEKIKKAVVEAWKGGLKNNLDELLKKYKPLEIINGPLMEGMKEVGVLFGENKLIVAEVLESAEIMKAAVTYLEQFMESSEENSSKAKIVLATVKGDVHDIGKNLVGMILENNGFEVVDLGIKVPSENIINKINEIKPDIIGLSGLLVRSTQQMINTAKDMSHAGITIPLLAGGAALTKKFTVNRIAPNYDGPVFYAKDAMNGLSLCNTLLDDENRESLIDEWMGYSQEAKDEVASDKKKREIKKEIEWIKCDVPEPPDLDKHIIDLDAKEVFKYINPSMLYGKHLGIKGVTAKFKKVGDEKLDKLIVQVKEVLEEAISEGYIAPKGIYQWYPAEGKESSIIAGLNNKKVEFSFPRSTSGKQVSAVDWLRPPEKGGDHIGFFVTTAGKDIGKKANELRNEGRLLASHILEVLGIEMAEAAAEALHKKMRKQWGIPDADGMNLNDLFKTKYHGIRLSFGYPACPDISDQERFFELLNPAEIGVKLTEGYMLDPESSVTALVFHHPEGKYYVAET